MENVKFQNTQAGLGLPSDDNRLMAINRRWPLNTRTFQSFRCSQSFSVLKRPALFGSENCVSINLGNWVQKQCAVTVFYCKINFVGIAYTSNES